MEYGRARPCQVIVINEYLILRALNFRYIHTSAGRRYFVEIHVQNSPHPPPEKMYLLHMIYSIY